MHSCSPDITPAAERSAVLELLTLRELPGVGDVGAAKLIAQHGSVSLALADRSEAQLSAARRSADAILTSVTHAGARLLTRQCTEYPARLLELHDAPTVIYARGTFVTSYPPAVAIVGTRAASAYGVRVARSIATACVRAGVAVVSGLARGIDAAAHEAALEAGGRTVAVLGTGVDVYYPRTHRTLQERIAREGLLLSELPPGESGHSGTFPRRNRIIAALADVTVVVEAGKSSGALITADQALELGRTVACVPNAIDLPSAFGSNALLKAHAEPILSPDDVLSLLNIQQPPVVGPTLDGDAARCWDALQRGATDIQSVARLASMSPREAAALLGALEVDGLVTFDVNGGVRPAAGLTVSITRA